MSTERLCIDCAHHSEIHDCLCPKRKEIKNLVTGQPIQHLSCIVLRSCFSYNGVQTCGPDCDWFEPKAPEPGEGFRFLKDGENIQPGDEYYDGEDWIQTKSAGRNMGESNSIVYRRRIAPDPGEGYRLLTMAEKTVEPCCLIQEDDAYWIGKWCEYPIKYIGQKFFDPMYPIRRRITPDPGPEYRLLTREEKTTEPTCLKQKGDCSYCNGYWVEFQAIGDKFEHPENHIRRLKEPQPLPCPDGHETAVFQLGGIYVSCTDKDCYWRSGTRTTKQEAIAAWNEVMAKKG